MEKLTSKDGFELAAYRAEPAAPPRGGLVVLQEIFGVNHHIRGVADRFAAEGYLTIAPAVFDRVTRGVELPYNPEGIAQGRELADKLQQKNTLDDIAAAIAAVATGGKVGIVGFCWGGSFAFASACRLPGLAAAVGYYGGAIAKMKDETPKVPTMLHFGDKDQSIPMTDVEAIRSAHPNLPIHVYAAGHGFNCDERASFDKASADVAWQRTTMFFAQHLA